MSEPLTKRQAVLGAVLLTLAAVALLMGVYAMGYDEGVKDRSVVSAQSGETK